MQYTFKSEPLNHQLSTFNNSKDKKYYGIFWEQGCGKTKLAIDNACYLYQTNKIDAVLVVAPPGVHRNWLTDELPKHVPFDLNNCITAVCWETKKANNIGFKIQTKKLLNYPGFSWLFISYNSFMTTLGKKYIKLFLSKRKCLYILDESHNIKNPTAKRTKAILSTGNYAEYRRVLTGTPVSQGPFDLYSQIKFLSDDFWKRNGIKNYTTYKAYFGEWFTRQESKNQLGYDPGYDKLLGYKNTDQLNIVVNNIGSRVTKESSGLNLPPKVYTKRYYELSTSQKKSYVELRDNFKTELSSGLVVTAGHALARLTRLQQIICGYIATENEEPLHFIGDTNPRLELFKEIIEGLYAPSIIWARYTKDIDLIMEFLGERAVRYDGTISVEDAEKNKVSFQRGDVQFFVGNPQKGKEGITLVQAKTVIYYSNSFNLIDRLQSEDRAHRIGQTSSVLYIDLIAPDTIDDHIVKCLINKHDIAKTITGDNVRNWL